jgi:HPt (histidine-containing phosphotransfer) domain-containing protein
MANPIRPAISDLSKLLAQFSGDKEFLKLMAQEYLAALDPYFNEIKMSVTNKNSEQLIFSAHKMEGSALNFYATALSETSHELKLLGQKKTFNNAENLLLNMSQQLNDLKQELIEIINSKAA